MNLAKLPATEAPLPYLRPSIRRWRWRTNLCPPPSRYEVLGPVLLLDLICGWYVVTGRAEQAALAIWGLLGLGAAWFLLQARPACLACFVLGAAPFINLLRNVKFYSGVPLLFASVLLFWMVTKPPDVALALRRCRPAFVFLAGAAVYYALSFGITGDWRVNLRVFELACAAAIVVMAGGQPGLLRQALWGLVLSALAVGLAAYPSLGERPEMRLGIVARGEGAFGNPFALGVPLALGVLLLALDRGRWLGLERRGWIRLALLVPTFVLLTLTASRAGWLVAAAGLAVAFWLGSRQRVAVLAAIGIVVATGYLLWRTQFAEPFRAGWKRTFGEDRSLSQATLRRSDQWVIFWHAWTDSPRSFVAGYGPGSGREVMARFTSRTSETNLPPGSTYHFHSQWLQVGVEWGLVVLMVLTAAMLAIFRRCFVEYRRARLVLPLSALAAYCGLLLVSICFDSISGSLLGLGLLTSGIVQPSGLLLHHPH